MKDIIMKLLTPFIELFRFRKKDTNVDSQNLDELLKQYHQIEIDLQKNIFPFRDKTNLILVLFAVFFGSIVFLGAVYFGQIENMTPLAILTFIIVGVIAGMAAYQNKNWGFLLVCIQNLVLALYIGTVNPRHYSEFITLIDAIVIFVFSTQYFFKGYVAGMVIILLKLLIFSIIFSINREFPAILASIVTFATLGIIPVLLHMVEQGSIRSKQHELHAKILSFEVEKLVVDWNKLYVDQPDQQRTEITDISHYTPTYSKSSSTDPKPV
jgi:hypothetical protein